MNIAFADDNEKDSDEKILALQHDITKLMNVDEIEKLNATDIVIQHNQVTNNIIIALTAFLSPVFRELKWFHKAETVTLTVQAGLIGLAFITASKIVPAVNPVSIAGLTIPGDLLQLAIAAGVAGVIIFFSKVAAAGLNIVTYKYLTHPRQDSIFKRLKKAQLSVGSFDQFFEKKHQEQLDVATKLKAIGYVLPATLAIAFTLGYGMVGSTHNQPLILLGIGQLGLLVTSFILSLVNPFTRLKVAVDQAFIKKQDNNIGEMMDSVYVLEQRTIDKAKSQRKKKTALKWFFRFVDALFIIVNSFIGAHILEFITGGRDTIPGTELSFTGFFLTAFISYIVVKNSHDIFKAKSLKNEFEEFVAQGVSQERFEDGKFITKGIKAKLRNAYIWLTAAILGDTAILYLYQRDYGNVDSNDYAGLLFSLFGVPLLSVICTYALNSSERGEHNNKKITETPLLEERTVNPPLIQKLKNRLLQMSKYLPISRPVKKHSLPEFVIEHEKELLEPPLVPPSGNGNGKHDEIFEIDLDKHA